MLLWETLDPGRSTRACRQMQLRLLYLRNRWHPPTPPPARTPNTQKQQKHARAKCFHTPTYQVPFSLRALLFERTRHAGVHENNFIFSKGEVITLKIAAIKAKGGISGIQAAVITGVGWGMSAGGWGTFAPFHLVHVKGLHSRVVSFRVGGLLGLMPSW